MDRPSISAVPPAGGSRPANAFNSVVLPAPLGPMIGRELARMRDGVEPLQNVAGFEPYAQASRFELHGASSARVLSTSQTKNGAPISAVSTPILSSIQGCTRRNPVSATSRNAAPASALAGSSSPGR